ncbi:MAG: hypothetical protein QM791_05435 [Ferruginibacter sp.]
MKNDSEKKAVPAAVTAGKIFAGIKQDETIEKRKQFIIPKNGIIIIASG